jgi:hypothetical protein
VRAELDDDLAAVTRPDAQTGWTALHLAASSRWHRLDPNRADGTTHRPQPGGPVPTSRQRVSLNRKVSSPSVFAASSGDVHRNRSAGGNVSSAHRRDERRARQMVTLRPGLGRSGLHLVRGTELTLGARGLRAQ